MASLRARLFIALSVFIVAAGSAAGGLAFYWAFAEAIELQDAILLQVGTLAVKTHVPAELPNEGGVDAEAQVIIEELDGQSATAAGADDRPHLSKGIADGLRTIAGDGHEWRVLVRTRPDGSRVAIAQTTENRDEIARDGALRTVLPLAGLIPCLLLLVGCVLHYSFRPVSELAARLNTKRSDQLEELPLNGMPEELHPFITSINRLLERIRIMFDQQRRFIADAAHELRTPITALSLQAENLGHVNLSKEGFDRLAILKTGIDRTAHLLEQLLDLARYESGRSLATAPTAFDRIVRDVMADFLPLAQIRLVDLGFNKIDEVHVRAEPTALRVLVRNLIDNALRHSPEGGHIDISLCCDGSRAVLTIADTGPGIPPKELDRILEPFYRGSQTEGDGSGLGLSIVSRIIDSLGGSMALENMPGRAGLCVVVMLPIKTPTEPEHAGPRNAGAWRGECPGPACLRRPAGDRSSHSFSSLHEAEKSRRFSLTQSDQNVR
jgi:two-component system, OmpR family, sensor kinase